VTLRLPDPRGSRAVLIGTSRYDSSDLPDLLAVRNNLEVLQELLTSDSFGGFPLQRCTVVQDAADPRSVCAAVREAALTATDALLVYFSGHGVLNENLDELHLALTGTDESDLRWTSIPFQAIREIFEASPCPNKILILDCCNSGQALDPLMGVQTRPRDTLRIRGTHILTSSARDFPSYAPVGERYTAFSGELIRLLRDGLPDKPELLTLSEVYGPLSQALDQRGYPVPRQQGSDGYNQLGLVRNRAAIMQAGAAGQAAPNDDAETADETAVGEIRFRPSRIFHQIRVWGIGLPASLALLEAAYSTGAMKDKTLDLTKPAQVIAMLAVVSIAAMGSALRKKYPGDYSLVLSPDGVEVQYSGSEHFSYPWHRISRCWVRRRPATRLRGPRYDLMVRPMPGVFPQTASRTTPGPHQEDAEDTLRFAELRRLATVPSAVEAALALYAGTAWTPGAEIAVQLAPSPEPQQVFTSARRVFAAVALVGAVLGFNFLRAAFARPMDMTTLAMCALALGTTWFAASRLIRPVRLVIGAAGLTLTRGELEIAYAWTEIERIGVVNWPRGARLFGLLAIQPTGSVEGMTDRTNMLLPKLAPKALTLCLLQEVTLAPQRLRDALARYADREQLALPDEAWLRTSAQAPAPPRTGATFRGRQPMEFSALIGFALFIPFMIGLNVAGPKATGWAYDLTDLLLAPLFCVGLPAYFLTGRQHVHFHVGPSGIMLSALGRRWLHIPWGDVDRIGMVLRPDPQEHALILWPRPDTAVPRFLWLPFQRRYGGLCILTLEKYRIKAPPEQVDQAIARYAGRRHTRMATLRYTAPKKK
jgi:hypothetical protein